MSNKFKTSTGGSGEDIFKNVAETRAKLALVPNTHIQSYDATLQGIANLTTTSGKLLKSNGTDTFGTINISSFGEDALNSSSPLLVSADLDDYITDTSFNATLANYSTTSSINTTLSDYVLTSALNTTLAEYSTTSTITTTLADYVLNSALNTWWCGVSMRVVLLQ